MDTGCPVTSCKENRYRFATYSTVHGYQNKDTLTRNAQNFVLVIRDTGKENVLEQTRTLVVEWVQGIYILFKFKIHVCSFLEVGIHFFLQKEN